MKVPAALAPFIAINVEYEVVLCTRAGCRRAVSPAGVVEHLHRLHRAPLKVRRQVQAFLQSLPWSYDSSSVVLPADRLAPQPVLPVVEGFQCRRCPFCTQSRKSMKVYGNRVHAIQRASDAQLY
jgi:hypothetical protein